MKVDLSAIDSGFDLIPSGKYPARITDGEVREAGPNAKYPGSEYINWEFTLTEDAGEYAGRKQWTNTSLRPEALFGLKALLESSGLWNKEELNAPDFDFDIDELFGEEVTLVVAVTQYQGEDQNTVKRIRPAGQATGSAGSSLLP